MTGTGDNLCVLQPLGLSPARHAEAESFDFDVGRTVRLLPHFDEALAVVLTRSDETDKLLVLRHSPRILHRIRCGRRRRQTIRPTSEGDHCHLLMRAKVFYRIRVAKRARWILLVTEDALNWLFRVIEEIGSALFWIVSLVFFTHAPIMHRSSSGREGRVALLWRNGDIVTGRACCMQGNSQHATAPQPGWAAITRKRTG